MLGEMQIITAEKEAEKAVRCNFCGTVNTITPVSYFHCHVFFCRKRKSEIGKPTGRITEHLRRRSQ